MRQLTVVENIARRNAWADWCNKDTRAQESFTFEAGFIAGMEYQQAKIKAYQAYVAGRITQKELDEAILVETVK